MVLFDKGKHLELRRCFRRGSCPQEPRNCIFRRVSYSHEPRNGGVFTLLFIQILSGTYRYKRTFMKPGADNQPAIILSVAQVATIVYLTHRSVIIVFRKGPTANYQTTGLTPSKQSPA